MADKTLDVTAMGEEAPFDHGLRADEAIKAFDNIHSEDLDLDEATENRLLRKIDLIILPLLCLVYGLNYLDKTTLSYASIMGLKDDIGLVGSDYQWLGTTFYFGYLGWEYPANRLLQRLPLAKYSAFCIIMWGVVLSCFAAVKNFAGAVTVRFFLGVFEASVTPGFVLLTSQWYTKQEHSARIALWVSFNGFAQIFGGLVAYGIARNSIHGYSIAPWQIIFLFAGPLTVIVGIIFLVVMPDSQLNAWWLNKTERVLAVQRIRRNQQGIGNRYFKSYQFKEALLDPITWAFGFLIIVSDIPNGGLTNFFSLLIESFGFTANQSLLYGTPAGAVEVIALLGWGFITQRFGNRILWCIFNMVIALLGSILIVALPKSNSGGRLAGYYITQAYATAFVALLSLIASNVAGYTKKTTVAALYLIGYCVGNIIGPQTFRAKDAPNYVPAEVVLIVCFGLTILDLVFIYFWYARLNSRKVAFRAGPSYQQMNNRAWMDLTDRENPDFVYEL